jgi:sugar lactone lactonase YvrE
MKPIVVVFALALWITAVPAQQYTISTFAGGAPPPATAGAMDVAIGAPLPAEFQGVSLATDSRGSVYIASASLNCVFRLDSSGILTRVAGNSRAGYSGDGGPTTSAQLATPWGVTVDGMGNLFIADDKRIRKVSTSGIITTVAGSGIPGFSGDGGPATSAQLNGAIALAVDSEGSLFIADYFNNRIRKVSTSGIITTVAGNGTLGYSGDGGPATSATLAQVTGVAVDGAGNVLIAAFDVVRKVTPDGIITSVAGGPAQALGDGGPATNAHVQPWGIAVDNNGNIFIADYLGRRIRKVSSNGTITTVAGGGPADPGDGGPAASAQLNAPGAVAVDGAGNLFIADGHLRKVSAGGIITTVAGNGDSIACCFSGDGGPATSAALAQVTGVAVDGARNLFVADYNNHRIRKVSPEGIITTVAGNGTQGFSGDGGPATSAELNQPRGVAVDAAGNLFIADAYNFSIRRVSLSGIITTVAGDGTRGFSADGGPATSARLDYPTRVAVDASGSLFIADGGRIRKVSPSGIITTVAGNATLSFSASSFSGDGGPAATAQLNRPNGVVSDASGNLFISDAGNHRVRKVSPSGIITTVAGNGGGRAGQSVHCGWCYGKLWRRPRPQGVRQRDNHRNSGQWTCRLFWRWRAGDQRRAERAGWYCGGRHRQRFRG